MSLCLIKVYASMQKKLKIAKKVLTKTANFVIIVEYKEEEPCSHPIININRG